MKEVFFISLLLLTFGLQAQTGPSGTTNCVLWLKADAGTNNGGAFVPTTGVLDEWIDQSGTGNHTTSSTASPFKIQNNISPENRMNYNPVVLFDDLTDGFIGPNLGMHGHTNLAEFYVFQSTPIHPTHNYLALFSLGYDPSGVYNFAHRFENDPWSDSYAIYDNNFVGNLGGANSTDSYFFQTIKTGLYDGANFLGYTNGILKTNRYTNFSINGVGGFRIGDCEPSGNQSRFSTGEIIIYDASISSVEFNRIDSYLGVKYGLTLGHDYLKSDNSVIYPIASHENNIVGLGRMDNSGLYQKQSHTVDDSIRIYLNTLLTTNAANSGVIANDQSFVIVGDDNRQLNATAASFSEIPASCSLYSRVEREWKVKRTEFSEDFNLDINLSSFASSFPVDPSDLRFIVDTDSDFSNGGTNCFFNGDGTGISITYNDPIITISGINTTHIPDNLIRYFTIGSIDFATPLPVEFISFDAQCIGNKVNLIWETSSESQNDYFSIEKSTDGEYFEPLAFVSGNGNTSSISSYSFEDVSFSRGVAYYRLSQFDYSGVQTVLSTTAVGCNDFNVSVYPNPFHEEFKVKSYLDGKVSIIDPTGKMIAQYPIHKGESTIKSNRISAGVYFVVVELINGDREVVKLTKN